MKILIVEDQSTDLVGPYMVLNHLGHEVTVAFDGDQALKLAKARDFNLIILDWNMPVLDGRQFLERLKTRHIQKIILLSGRHLTREDVPESKYFELIDIWKKPLGSVDMLKKIKDHLLTHRRRAA